MSFIHIGLVLIFLRFIWNRSNEDECKTTNMQKQKENFITSYELTIMGDFRVEEERE